MQESTHALVIVLVLSVSAGCTVGPNYQRPAIQTPDSFRAPEPIPAGDPASLADLKWWEVFKDEKLQELEQTALAQNYDLRDAVARVEAARANLGITRCRSVSERRRRRGTSPPPDSRAMAKRRCRRRFVPSQNRTFGQATLNLLSFELDIWGRLRRATEAARANLLASEENRKAVITTLVSDVASAYFSLRNLDYQLEISQRTLATRQESLELIQNRQTGGVATLLDLAAGRATGVHRSRDNPHSAATDRADRKPDQLAAGKKSRAKSCAAAA